MRALRAVAAAVLGAVVLAGCGPSGSGGGDDAPAGSSTQPGASASADPGASPGVSASPGDLVFGNLSAFDIDLSATLSMTGGNIDSATDITADAGTDMSLGNLSAGGFDGEIFQFGDVSLTAGGDASAGLVSAAGAVTADAVGGITALDVDAFDAVDLTAGTSIGVGNVTAGSVAMSAGTNLTAGDISAFDSVLLNAGGSMIFGDISAFIVNLSAGGSIDGGDIDSETDIIADAGGDIDLLVLTAGGSTGEGFTEGSVALTAGGGVNTGSISALGDVEIDAGTSIRTGDIDGYSVDAFAIGDIATGNITTFAPFILLGGDIGTLLFPGASITLEAGGDIATGDLSSIDGVYANAGGGISAGAIDAADFVELHAGDDIGTGNITAGQYIWAFSGGSQSLGNLDAGLDIDLEAGGDIAFGNLNTGADFDFDAGGNVTGGDIVAVSSVGGEGAGGSVTFGDITAGPDNDGDNFSVGFSAGGSISVGNVNGTDSVGFATLGDLTTGNIEAGQHFIALVSGDITTGSITTGEGARVYMADASMCVTGGGCSDAETDFDPEIVLALDPVPTGGSITIGGPVSTGLFRAAAGATSTPAIYCATRIDASAGGTATLNGLWTAQDVDAGVERHRHWRQRRDQRQPALVTLFSTNATQALIGDGLTGSGYALSNAEFGRIEGGSVYILARGDASAAIDMLIGDLTVTGPSAGSTIENSDGILVFATGDIDSRNSERRHPRRRRRHRDRLRIGQCDGILCRPVRARRGDRLDLDHLVGRRLGRRARPLCRPDPCRRRVDPRPAGGRSAICRLSGRPECAGGGAAARRRAQRRDHLDRIRQSAEHPDPEHRHRGNAGRLPGQRDLRQRRLRNRRPAGFDRRGRQRPAANRRRDADRHRGARRAGRGRGPDPVHRQQHDQRLPADRALRRASREPPFPPGFTPTPGIQQEIVLIKRQPPAAAEFGNEDFIDDNDEATDEGDDQPDRAAAAAVRHQRLGERRATSTIRCRAAAIPR